MKQLTLVVLALITQSLSAATYKVPAPEELTDFSHWKLTGTHAKIVNQQLEVSYSLPQELVGKTAPVITFKGTVGTPFVAVKGNSVRGLCMVFTAQPVTCMLRYPKTLIDPTSRAEFLSENFSGGDLLSAEQVARFFSDDPAGLLSVDLESIRPSL